MVMHLVKLCVGAKTIEDLERWRKQELARRAAAGEPPVIVHVTRMFPKAKAEIEAGGSLYWVINRRIQCRSEIISLEEVVGEDGIRRCAIIMDPDVIRTHHLPRRAFQGWRYLKPEDAPADIRTGEKTGEDLPPELRAKLMELGAW